MTTKAKSKRLKELTKVRVSQEKQVTKLQNEIDNLKERAVKKAAALNSISQQLLLTNGKLSTLAAEISAEINAQNKAY
jgi:hypothetical protein